MLTCLRGVYVGTSAIVYLWRSKDNFWELILSKFGGSSDVTCLSSLHGRWLPLSHLSSTFYDGASLYSSGQLRTHYVD